MLGNTLQTVEIVRLKDLSKLKKIAPLRGANIISLLNLKIPENHVLAFFSVHTFKLDSGHWALPTG
jgi:hypothetical protein